MVIPLQFFVLNMAIALENHSNQDGGMSIQRNVAVLILGYDMYIYKIQI